MPHIIVEYSANLKDRMDLQRLLDRLHATAIETGVFPIGGTRTRAAERTDYRLADGHAENAFVHVAMRIGQGRDVATRKMAGQAVFDALCVELQAVYAAGPLGLSLDIDEIESETSFKQNNMHAYVQARRSKAAE
jgi:5-carboxymethyl-2-hydroxymuconate isomerase